MTTKNNTEYNTEYDNIIKHIKVIPLTPNISYEDIQSHLFNRGFINSTTTLLQTICNETIVSNTKRFLVSYLIYHKHVYNENPTELELEIIKAATDMLNSLHNTVSLDNSASLDNSTSLDNSKYIEYKETFIKYYNTYIEKYTTWATLDKRQLNTSLIHAHSELSNTQKFLNDNRKENTSDDIKQSQDQLDEEITGKLEDIENRLRVINGVKKAEDIKAALTANDETIQDDSIFKIAKKAFWDIFTEEIERNDYSRLFIILDEIKTRLKALTPNRQDIHTDIDQNIDIDLYKQMISNGAFETEDFMKLIEYLVTKIKQYIAPVHDTEIGHWVTKLYENIGDKYSKTLPAFFEEYYNYLEITEKEIADFRKSVQERQSKK